MKKIILIIAVLFSMNSYSQWNPSMDKDASTALQGMLKDAPKLQPFYDQAYGYAVFPKITKAGIGIGAAAGNGVVYKGKSPVGSSKLKQASVGLQLGGQQYSEVIFFENKEAFENFTNGNLKFGAQASAVAITSGASIDAAYNDGVAVFTHVKGGLMYEASIGGQHFSYEDGQK